MPFALCRLAVSIRAIRAKNVFVFCFFFSSAPGGRPGSKKPLPQDDPIQRKPDITLAQKYLNWWPGVELEEGLQETIDYFRTRLTAWA